MCNRGNLLSSHRRSSNWLICNDKRSLDPKNILGPFPAVNAQERLKKLVREIVLLVYHGNPPPKGRPIPLFGVASALCRTPATHRPRLQDWGQRTCRQ